MAFFNNNDSYIDLINDLATTSSQMLDGFDYMHSVVFQKFYLIAFLSLGIGAILKYGRHAVAMGDKISTGNYVITGTLLGLFLIPTNVESPNGETLVMSKGYVETKKIVSSLLEYSTGLINSVVKNVYNLQHEKTYSPALAMYQTASLDSILSKMGDPNLMGVYHDYRNSCKAHVGQNRHLKAQEKEALGFGVESVFGEGDTLATAYDNKYYRVYKFFSSNGESQAMRKFDSVTELVAGQHLIPQDFTSKSYSILNGAYLKASLINDDHKPGVVAEDAGKLIRLESGNDQFRIVELEDRDVIGTSSISRSYTRGFEEYRNYLTQRISGQQNENLSAYLKDPGMPLDDSNSGAVLKLVPIDCVSFAMITNIIINQFAAATGSSTLFTNEPGKLDISDNVSFASRMLAVAMAQQTLKTGFADAARKQIDHEEQSFYEKISDVGEDVVNFAVGAHASYEETKNKIRESYEVDVAVPVVFSGIILVLGFFLTISPVILTISFVLPDGMGIGVSFVKIILFLGLSMVFGVVAIQFIDVQITQSVNVWLVANSRELPPFGGDYDLASSLDFQNAKPIPGDIGPASLSAKVLAASQASTYTYFIGLIISYGLVYDFRAYFRRSSGSSSLGSSNSKSVGNLMDKMGGK